MILAMYLLQSRLIDMGVNLGCGKAGVAEHLLDRAQIGPMAEQVRGKRMAQEVRPDLFLQAGELCHLLYDLPDSRRSQAAAMIAQKQFATGLGFNQRWTAPCQPLVEPQPERSTNGLVGGLSHRDGKRLTNRRWNRRFAHAQT